MRIATPRVLLLCAAGGWLLGLTSCAPAEPFRVTALMYPSTLPDSASSRGSLSVQWSGDPQFPVTLSVAAPCSSDTSPCRSWIQTFAHPSNPLVWNAAISCRAGAPGVVIDVGGAFGVRLLDAASRSTQLVGAQMACGATTASASSTTLQLGTQPSIASTLRAPDEVSWAAGDILRSIGLAVVLLGIVMMRALAVRFLIEERLREHPPHEHPIPAALAVVLTAALAVVLDPSAGADLLTLEAFAGGFLGVAVLCTVLCGVRALTLRVLTGRGGSLRVSRAALLTSLLLVVVCRAAGAQPGLFCGAVLSYQPGPGADVTRHRKHVLDLVGDGVLLVVSLAAWLGWAPLKAAAATGSGTAVVFSTMVAAMFIGGVTSVLARPVLPSPEGGGASDRVSVVSAIVFALAAFLLMHVVVNSSLSATDPERMYIVLVVIAVLISTVSYVTWAYAQRRDTTRLSPR